MTASGSGCREALRVSPQRFTLSIGYAIVSSDREGDFRNLVGIASMRWRMLGDIALSKIRTCLTRRYPVKAKGRHELRWFDRATLRAATYGS